MTPAAPDTDRPQAASPPRGPATRLWPSLAGWLTLYLLLLLAAGGASSTLEGALLGLPSAVAALGWLLAILVLWRATGIEAGRAALGLAFVPLLVLLALPLPGVRAFSGPPLFALAAAGAVLVLARGSWRPPAWSFLPAVLALYCAIAWRVQTQVGPQGDEPHYLMVADSLLRDGDLSLESDYAQGRYLAFHPAPLSPHYRVRGKGGQIYSLHALGLSLLLLPAYALGGYPAASFFMALLAAVLARELRELAREWTGDARLGQAAGWLMALSPPLIHYAGLLFTEVPAALLATIALRRAGHRCHLHGTLWWALALAFLPWLHVRYVALAGVLLLYALLRRPTRTAWVVLGGAIAVSAAVSMAYHQALYGFLDPRRVWGRRPELSLSLLPHGLQGLLLDQEFGLLVYAPVFVLAAPGLVLLWRRSRLAAATAGALIAVALLTAGAWPMWRGGFNPPARFLVPALPALAVAVAATLRGGPSVAGALLIGWGLWSGGGGAWQPSLVHRDRDGTAPFFRMRSGAEEWTRLLPGYVLDDSALDRGPLALVWGGALVLAAAAWRRPRGSALGVALATAGFLGAAAAASGVSRGRSGGRDAIRVIGRPALAVPGWRWAREAEGAWDARELDWGPLYEPHRHPGGAEVGQRLPLRQGVYRILLERDPLPGVSSPTLAVRPDGSVRVRSVTLEDKGAGLEGIVSVEVGDRAVTLSAVGGGPFVLQAVRLQRLNLSPRPRSNEARRAASGGAAAGALTEAKPR